MSQNINWHELEWLWEELGKQKPRQVIAIGNNKPGIGKTTTTINLAHYFAREHWDTLIVDMTEGHQCLSILRDENTHVIGGDGLDRLTYSVRPFLYVLAYDETQIEKKHKHSSYMEEVLANLRKRYSLIFLDAARERSSYLISADWYIILTMDDSEAMFSTERLLQTMWYFAYMRLVSPIMRELDTPRLLGILPNFQNWDAQGKQFFAKIMGTYGRPWVLPPIPRDPAIAQAFAAHKTVWELDCEPECIYGAPTDTQSPFPNCLGKIGGYDALGRIVWERVLGVDL